MADGDKDTGPNLAAALQAMAARMPDSVAILHPTGPRWRGRDRYTRLTYAELGADVHRIAAGLTALGIGRGVRCALMVKPSPDFFALAFALFEAGVVPVMIDPGIGLPALKTCLAEAQPEAFIGIPEAHAARLALGWAKDSIRTLVTVGPRLFWGGSTLSDVRRLGDAQRGWKSPQVESSELAAILFTSGSTGIPKGAVYSHGNFHAQVELLKSAIGIEPGEVDLPTFPLFALFDPALGMTTVLPHMDPTKPALVDPLEVLEPVRMWGVTNMFGSPALLNRVGRYGAPRGEKMLSLRRVISAGAPVPADVIERFVQMLDPRARILTPYGATEALPVAVVSHSEILGETRLRTEQGAGVCVGRPVDGVRVELIEIRDTPIDEFDDSMRVTGETIGEITVSGPNVTERYWARDEATKLAKMRGPNGEVMHRMGDVGWRDASGRLWFCGRKSHRVVTEEGTYFTEPCEQPFCAHPDVFRAALVGIERHGKTEPVMCIELEKGKRSKSDPALLAELRAIAQQHAHTQAIKTFLFPGAFPVDIRHNSKIFREKLRVWAQAHA